MNFDERIREERLKIDDAKIKGVRNVCEFADEQLTDERIGEIQTDLERTREAPARGCPHDEGATGQEVYAAYRG